MHVLPSESAAGVGVRRVGVAEWEVERWEVVRWELVGVGEAVVVTDTFSTDRIVTQTHGDGMTQTNTQIYTETHIDKCYHLQHAVTMTHSARSFSHYVRL